MIPVALGPIVKSIRGLYSTIDEQPFHHATTMQSDSPGMTITSGGVTLTTL